MSARAAAISRSNAVAPAVAKKLSAPAPAARKESDWKPQTTFTRSFTVSHSVDVVWEFFGNIPEVASCLPGASLAGDPIDGHVEGQIKVKLGAGKAASEQVIADKAAGGLIVRVSGA